MDQFKKIKFLDSHFHKRCLHPAVLDEEDLGRTLVDGLSAHDVAKAGWLRVGCCCKSAARVGARWGNLRILASSDLLDGPVQLFPFGSRLNADDPKFGKRDVRGLSSPSKCAPVGATPNDDNEEQLNRPSMAAVEIEWQGYVARIGVRVDRSLHRFSLDLYDGVDS